MRTPKKKGGGPPLPDPKQPGGRAWARIQQDAEARGIPLRPVTPHADCDRGAGVAPGSPPKDRARGAAGGAAKPNRKAGR